MALQAGEKKAELFFISDTISPPPFLVLLTISSMELFEIYPFFIRSCNGIPLMDVKSRSGTIVSP